MPEQPHQNEPHLTPEAANAREAQEGADLVSQAGEIADQPGSDVADELQAAAPFEVTSAAEPSNGAVWTPPRSIAVKIAAVIILLVVAVSIVVFLIALFF